MTDETTVSSPLTTEPEAPDRNLALELVRVTEARGPGRRPLGRPRRQERRRPGSRERHAPADQHRVHAGRRRDRRGREGRRSDAVQRRARRGRRRRRSATWRSTRSTAPRLTAQGMTNAIAVLAVAPARLDVRPVRRVLHGEAGHRPGGGRRRRHRAPDRATTSGRSRRPRAARPTTSPSCILDRPRHEGIVQEVREAGRADQVHHGRRRGGRDHGVPRRARASTCCSASAARRRASSRPARSRRWAG